MDIWITHTHITIDAKRNKRDNCHLRGAGKHFSRVIIIYDAQKTHGIPPLVNGFFRWVYIDHNANYVFLSK